MAKHRILDLQRRHRRATDNQSSQAPNHQIQHEEQHHTILRNHRAPEPQPAPPSRLRILDPFRVTTIYNDVIQGGYTAVTKFYKPPVLKQALTGIRSLIETMNTRICQLAAKQHALCVGDYHIFNGPHGTAPMPPGSFTAKYGDLNQFGQNKIAAAIIELGWAPLKIR